MGKKHIYKDGLKNSLAEKLIWWYHISCWWLFLTNEIQVLQHHRKKCVNRKEDFIEKQTSFEHIPWEYLGQPMNFSADPCMELIWSHSMRVSWSAYELFGWPLYKPHMVAFHESMLVSLWTFHTRFHFMNFLYPHINLFKKHQFSLLILLWEWSEI